MTKADFISAISALSFDDEGGGAYFREARHLPDIWAHVYDDGVVCVEHWSATTPAVELTEPDCVPFEQALQALKDRIAKHERATGDYSQHVALQTEVTHG